MTDDEPRDRSALAPVRIKVGKDGKLGRVVIAADSDPGEPAAPPAASDAAQAESTQSSDAPRATDTIAVAGEFSATDDDANRPASAQVSIDISSGVAADSQLLAIDAQAAALAETHLQGPIATLSRGAALAFVLSAAGVAGAVWCATHFAAVYRILPMDS